MLCEELDLAHLVDVSDEVESAWQSEKEELSSSELERQEEGEAPLLVQS